MTHSPMLPQFQRSFASGLLERQTAKAAPDGLHWDALRYGVHVQNTRVSLRGALENVFPVTRQLVGADFFAAMAGQFVATHPPTHGWLSAYGDAFPDFVAHYQPAENLGYLSDIARIEWASIRAANAPDDPGLDLKTLMRLEPEVLERLVLKLHQAASIIGSPFPVFDIWRAHQHACGDEQSPQIDLAKGSQNVLVSRAGMLEVGVVLLGTGDTAFLTALARHSTFDACCRAAISDEPDYDLGVMFGDLVRMRALAALDSKQ
jgi:hypothetical protein